MTDGMFLDDEEIAQLTKRQRKPAQSKVLTFMGIEHRLRPDGSIVVLRAHVERLLGEGVAPVRNERKTEPNWAALDEINARSSRKKK